MISSSGDWSTLRDRSREVAHSSLHYLLLSAKRSSGAFEACAANMQQNESSTPDRAWTSAFSAHMEVRGNPSGRAFEGPARTSDGIMPSWARLELRRSTAPF